MVRSVESSLGRVLAQLRPNRRLTKEAHVRLLRQLRGDPQLVRELLNLVIDDDAFHTQRGLSAMGALKILGESKVTANYLRMKLASGSGNIRVSAARAFESLPQRSAVRYLKHRALKDKNLLVRMYCLSALVYLTIDHPAYKRQLMPVFLKAIRHRSEKIRTAGYEGLHWIRLPKAARALRGALKDPAPLVRARAALCWVDGNNSNY